MSKRPHRHQPALPIAQLLTIAQVADLLCVHRTTVYDFIKKEGLPVLKLGSRSPRVDSSKLQQWINDRAGLSAWEAQPERSIFLWQRTKKASHLFAFSATSPTPAISSFPRGL